MRNQQVVKTWLNGKHAKSGNGCLTTDGQRLFSYEVCIGATAGAKRVVYNYREERKISLTTLRHVNIALKHGGDGVQLVDPPETDLDIVMVTAKKPPKSESALPTAHSLG